MMDPMAEDAREESLALSMPALWCGMETLTSLFADSESSGNAHTSLTVTEIWRI